MKYFSILVISTLLCFGLASCVKKKEKTQDMTVSSEEPMEKIATDPVYYSSHEPKKQQAPFSDAVQVGNTFYLSGQIGMDHSIRELVSGGIVNETKQTLENIKDVLAQHGLELTDVVKVMVVVDDIDNFSAFNTIYESYFPQKPARTTFAASALAKGAAIEIEVVAIKPTTLSSPAED